MTEATGPNSHRAEAVAAVARVCGLLRTGGLTTDDLVHALLWQAMEEHSRGAHPAKRWCLEMGTVECALRMVHVREHMRRGDIR